MPSADPQFAAVCHTCGEPYACFGDVPPGSLLLDCSACDRTRRFFEQPLRFDASGLVFSPLPATSEGAQEYDNAVFERIP